MNMNPTEILSSQAESLSLCCCERLEGCENQIRRRPWASLLAAVLIGWLLHLLPVRGTLRLLGRTLLLLSRPALVIFGALRLLSCVGTRCCSKK